MDQCSTSYSTSGNLLGFQFFHLESVADNICSHFMRLFGATNEIIYVKALCMQQRVYMGTLRHYVHTPMNNAEYSYFTLKRNIQVTTILGIKIYKGKKVRRKTDENFHLIETTGLYYSCKPFQFTHGLGNKVLTGFYNK